MAAVDHKTKSIFIHIPKTAGKTTRQFLGLSRDSAHPNFHARPNDKSIQKHWDDYYTFTFVRNPLDRAVSAFFFDHEKHRRGIDDKSGIRSMVAKYPKTKDGFSKYFLDFYEFDFLSDYKFVPQTTIMQGAKFDFVGKFESLGRDLRFLYEKLYNKTGKNKSVKHLNRTKSDIYDSYYTEKALAIATEYYAEDYRVLRYVREEP